MVGESFKWKYLQFFNAEDLIPAASDPTRFFGDQIKEISTVENSHMALKWRDGQSKRLFISR